MPTNYPTMGFLIALSVQEYWKFNISKNVSILTVFYLKLTIFCLEYLIFWLAVFIKDRENP